MPTSTVRLTLPWIKPLGNWICKSGFWNRNVGLRRSKSRSYLGVVGDVVEGGGERQNVG
jgi:hypothetical protein